MVAAALPSILLAVGWVRSYSALDFGGVGTIPTDPGGDSISLNVTSHRGHVAITLKKKYRPFRSSTQPVAFFWKSGPAGAEEFFHEPINSIWRKIGFAAPDWGQPSVNAIILPYWFLFALSLLPGIWPVRGFWRWWRAYKRSRYGLCAACGYDLRGGGDRCPECGAAAAGGKERGNNGDIREFR